MPDPEQRPFATSRLRTSKRPRLLWQPGQLRCVRGAGRLPPAPLPFSRRPPGQARPLRCAGVGVCRYHGKGALGGHILPQGGSALGIREGGGVTGAVERGGERVRTREESRIRRTRAFGVGMGSLESVPLHTLALRRLPALLPQTLVGVQAPHLPFPGKGSNYRPRRSFGFLQGGEGFAEPSVHTLPRPTPDKQSCSPDCDPKPCN